MTDVIVAGAGSGTRFSTTENKLLGKFPDGKTVLRRSVEAFLTLPSLGKIIVTARSEDVDEYSRTLEGIPCVVIVEGGATRVDSVQNALAHVTGKTVLVHDGARPFVTPKLIALVEGAVKDGCGVVPALPITDTVKTIDGNTVVGTPDRASLVRVQTPQGFDTDCLKRAYAVADIKGATDDASVMERAGYTIVTVDGEESNVKITYAGDKKLLNGAVRTGIGYDVHALVEGRKLMLGCTEVPYEKGLLGHSDADVVAHAICDALLSASGLRDIGYYFPDTSEDTEGMSGTEILTRTVAIVREKGYEPVNVAVVCVAQRPKLAPYIETMQARIAEALQIDVGAVSVSATTTERLGFEGRGEGISAQAVANVQ